MFFPGGGIGRYTHELACALQNEDGVTVAVIGSPDFEYRESTPYEFVPALPSISHRVPWIRKSRFLLAQGISPRRCLTYAQEREFDVIHFSNINHLTYPFWRQRARQAPQKIVATAHDVRRGQRILNRRWETKALAQFYRDSDQLFVHAQSQVDDLSAFAQVEPSKVEIVPHGTYPYPAANRKRAELRESFGITPGRPVGLYFGSVRDDKNLDGVLQALTQISGPRPFLVVAGRIGGSGHRSAEAYRDLIRELGLEQDVCLSDRFIDEDEVGDFFEMADFALLTYRTSFTSQSGVLNVAMHYGVPVIATPAPTLAETVGRYDIGVVCRDDQPAGIADGLRSLLAKIEAGYTFDFAPYQAAHSWAATARQTAACYRKLLAQSG